MIAAVADDLTGAGDVGAAFTAAGWPTQILLLDAAEVHTLDDAAAVVLDTETRHAPPAQAAARVRRAVGLLSGADLIYKKIDSGFRGNVGAEIEAALDAVGVGFAAVVPAFPAQGRTTVAGAHYVHGRPIHETEMARDPLHPMADAFLPRVLGAQTQRPVHLVAQADLPRIDALRRQGGMAIVDAATDADLARVADALGCDRLVCGASALAGELAKRMPPPERSAPWDADTRALARARTLVVSGSASVVAGAQLLHAAAAGAAVVRVAAAAAVASDAALAREATCAAKLCTASAAPCVCIAASSDVRETQALGQRRGIAAVGVGARVARLLAETVREALAASDFGKLIVFGGSTALAVFEALGLVGQRLLGSVAPGVPWGMAIGLRDWLVVLKPGSFGDADFVAQAEACLRQGPS